MYFYLSFKYIAKKINRKKFKCSRKLQIQTAKMVMISLEFGQAQMETVELKGILVLGVKFIKRLEQY